MAYRPPPKTTAAGLAAFLLIVALAVPATALAEDHDEDDDNGLGSTVGDVVEDVSGGDGSDQEAAEDDEPEEVTPDAEPEGEDAEAATSDDSAPEEEAPQQEAPEEEAPEEETSGGDAAPSGPRTATGPGMRHGGTIPRGNAGSPFDAAPDVFDAQEPEVFTEDGASSADDDEEVASAALLPGPGERAGALAGAADVPRELVATAVALVVLLGSAHALHATRRIAS